MLAFARKRPLLTVLAASLAVRVLAATANVGFVAIDDYIYMLELAFPVRGLPSLESIFASSSVHPTLPMFLLLGLSRIPAVLGIGDPLNQIRVVYLIMGLWSLLSVYLAYKFFETIGRSEEGIVAAFLVGLHGMMPFFSTRVLFETFAMGFITLSAFFFHLYYRDLKSRNLLSAILCIVVASMLRYQSGICFLAMSLLVLTTRRCRKDLPLFVGTSLAFFVLTGLFDVLLHGEFHYSIRLYLDYNLHHSSSYGTSSPLTFVGFFIAFTLPPFLVINWKGYGWRRSYRDLTVPLVFFLLFLAAHSLTPHKEDRFMVPILPIFLVLAAPLVSKILSDGRTVRVRLFFALNLIILILASSFTAQWNAIGLARYLHSNRDITVVYNFERSLIFNMSAYMDRPDLQMIDADTKTDISSLHGDCRQVVAVREDRRKRFEPFATGLHVISKSAPGPLEWLIVKANPSHNGRRATISLYADDSCPQG